MKNKNYWLALFSFIGVLVMIASCEKDEDNLKEENIVNIDFSTDTIISINESVPLSGTQFSNSTRIERGDTNYYCLISINKYHPSIDIDIDWLINIRIPKEIYNSTGTYEIGSYNQDSWIELEKYYKIEDNSKIVYQFTSYDIENNSGSFTLSNETDSTINLEFRDISLYNANIGVYATISCNLIIRDYNGE